MGTTVTLKDIQAAAQAMAGVVHATPLDRSHTFSQLTGSDIYMKLENLQKTGSFKIRGAYNKIHSLTSVEKAQGVIAASAGNHAQGVAYAARQAGIKATIVMPQTAPLAKIMATRGYGAEVVLSGLGYDEAYEKATEIQKESGQTYIHAYDDPAVMAGQGTIGLEILKELEEVTAVVVPIGGGGLIAGLATAIKETAPHVKIYGVQAQGAPAVYMSKKAHTLKCSPDAITIADGIAVKSPGELTFPLIDRYVDDVVVVDDEAIASTILMLLERSKMMVEGAGAIALTAVLQEKIPIRGKLATVMSGGNIDVNFIAQIIERGLVKAGRRVRIVTPIPDRPGVLQNLLAVIARLQANVLHISHDRVEGTIPIGQALTEISLETRDAAHTEELVASLRQAGYNSQIR